MNCCRSFSSADLVFTVMHNQQISQIILIFLWESKMETEEKEGVTSRVMLSSAQWFIDLCAVSPSLFTAGWSKLDCFLLLWLTSAFTEQCFQTCSDIFSRLKCFLFYFSVNLSIPSQMTQFFESTLRLSWQLTSVKLNNLQSIVTTLSTRKQRAEDDKWHFCHLLPGPTKHYSPVQAWNHVCREILHFWEKKEKKK